MSNSSTDNFFEPLANTDVTAGAQQKQASALKKQGSSAGQAGSQQGTNGAAAPLVTCYLSLIVPAYNEEQRLPATLMRMVEYLALRDFSYEIVVVDDGSRDGTRDLVREFAATRSFVRLECYDDENGKPLNRGKGYAVRHGVLSARGRDILFSDADLSTPIEEMEKLLPAISRGDCDMAIASRALPESNLTVHQPWYRERMGRLFNTFVQRIIDTQIMDTQCGFKAFRGDVAKRLFGMAQIDGFGFDTEILFLAQKFKYRVREVPVTWEHRDDSRVSPLSAPFQMLSELLQVRLNDIRGLYDEDEVAPDAQT
jgi:dolichyl-phosphate beta-glucosyltransferase